MKTWNFKAFLAVFLVVLVLGATFLTGCITVTQSPESTETPAVTTPIDTSWTPPVNTETATQLPNIADVVALVKPSVVAISTEVTTYDFFNRPYTQEGAGSGWVIDPDGIIVTNYHVVEGANTITVTTDNGDTYIADVNSIFTDPLNDLAIIKIDATDLPALKRGTASNMRVGDWVVAIGNALGQGTRATEGIVSRQGVSLQVDYNQTLYDLIETSAAINPGNSGGPLVNLAGEVIGITSAKIASVGVEGMGYAISIDTAMPIIEELVTNGYITRPWLGVMIYTVDQIAISQFNLKVDEGVLITQVVADSPAYEAGLQRGDVIVSIGGENIATVEELTQVLHAAPIGETLEIRFYRGDMEYVTNAVPIESPRPETG